MTENKSDEKDPFTTHDIATRDQQLLVGAADRNNDKEMDIVLDEHYPNLEALQRIAVKNYATKQARAQARVQGLTKDDVIQVTRDYIGQDLKDLSTAVSTLDNQNQENKAKVNSLAYHVDNQAKKSESKNEEIGRRIQKFHSLTRLALDIFTMSSYLGTLIAVGVGLGLDTTDGKSVFDFLMMLSSLLIFGFIKQFPDLTVDMCIGCRKSYQTEDIWIFHRIRNAILSNVTTVVSLLVDFGEISIFASIFCYGGALICLFVLAYHTLKNINEIHKLLKILRGIADGDAVTADILQQVTVALGTPLNSKLVESLDRLVRQNSNSNGSNDTIANQAARIKIKYTK